MEILCVWVCHFVCAWTSFVCVCVCVCVVEFVARESLCVCVCVASDAEEKKHVELSPTCMDSFNCASVW